ncbi:MAG: glycosyltransferase family 2 protein [Thiobacillus sp.]|nr:glycosyltransferase family 2 protein [Thiobacillus sp.]
MALVWGNGSMKISVCLAMYNGANYLVPQIRSILDQLGQFDEIVVVDDCSQDESVQIVNAFGDSRIRLIRNDSNLGILAAFEGALRESAGDIIFLSDQDDVWLPGKVERCLAALVDCPLVVTDCAVVDSELELLSPSFFRLRHSRPGVLHNLWKNTYLGCCMAFRRELLQIALPFPNRIPMHDMWLGMIAEIHGGTCFVPEPLLLYRRHGGNASDTAGRSTARLSKMIADRVFLASLVAARTLRHRLP